MENQEVVPLRQPSAPSRLSKAEVINSLSACLALVKPVSMSEDMATEWLAVAAGEVIGLHPSAFMAGCAEARRECTHHGQIVPTILNGKEAKWWRSMGKLYSPVASDKPLQISDNHETQKLIEGAVKALTDETR